MDPTGNTACTVGATGGFDPGDIQSTATSPLNAPFNINVVVDNIPAGSAPEADNGGLYGVGYELNYDPPTVIRVTAASGGAGSVLHLSSNTTGCGAPGTNPVPLEVFDGVPNTDGSFRVDTIDLSGFEESPTGRVTTIQIECVAVGTSTLTLTDTSTGGGNNMGVLGDSGGVVFSDPGSGFTYVEYEATVNCVEGATFGAQSAGFASFESDSDNTGANLAPVDPNGIDAAAAVPVPQAAVAGAAQAPAQAAGPGALPSAGGEPFTIGGQSMGALLMLIGAFAVMAGAAAVSWSLSRRPE